MQQLKSYIDNQMAVMVRFLGDTLMEVLEEVAEPYSEAPDSEQKSRDRAILDNALRYVCNKAFYQAIPSLDLVLTPTGFGIVSNQNVAPASAERVAALRKSLADSGDDAFDALIAMLRGDERWCELPVAEEVFSSFFWRGRDMLSFGNVDPHRSNLIENRVAISMAEERLQNTISRELFEALCSEMRRNTLSVRRSVFVSLCRRYIAAVVTHHRPDYERRAIIAYLERHNADFEEYMTSSAYEANHYVGYQNRKDDPCYFF